jgi:pyrimidine deaminase RibD-like protein
MPKDTKSKRVEDLLCSLHYLNSGEAGRFTVASRRTPISLEEREFRNELLAAGVITETRHGSLALTQKGVDEAVAIMNARSLEEQLQVTFPEDREGVMKELDYWVRRQQEGQPGSIHWEQVGGRIAHLRHLEQRFAEAERTQAHNPPQPTTETIASSEELLPADEAIRLLQTQLNDEVESLRHDDVRVETWKRLTLKIVRRAFGEKSQNAKHYAVTMSYARQADEEKQAWHVQHIRDKKTMLHAFIKELEVIPPVRPHSVVSDEDFARMALEEARKSKNEDDRPHPKVGCVVVKDGRVLAKAHRGEFEACHAEYAALEKKLKDETLAGCTVYATLEPCTGRNSPKVPCADRLIARRVARVVIGVLDPNPEIRGNGVLKLQAAGIAVTLFPPALANELLELNRDFIRSFTQPGAGILKAKEDRAIQEKRKLYKLISKINCIQCKFAFPPGPQEAVFNGSLISQINRDIDAIRDDLVDLLDLPEAKAVIDLRIPSAPYEGASWLWLEATWREYFQPLQEIFIQVKAEVLHD